MVEPSFYWVGTFFSISIDNAKPDQFINVYMMKKSILQIKNILTNVMEKFMLKVTVEENMK